MVSHCNVFFILGLFGVNLHNIIIDNGICVAFNYYFGCRYRFFRFGFIIGLINDFKSLINLESSFLRLFSVIIIHAIG